MLVWEQQHSRNQTFPEHLQIQSTNFQVTVRQQLKARKGVIELAKEEMIFVQWSVVCMIVTCI